jgi:hypothetical protein
LVSVFFLFVCLVCSHCLLLVSQTLKSFHPLASLFALYKFNSSLFSNCLLIIRVFLSGFDSTFPTLSFVLFASLNLSTFHSTTDDSFVLFFP